MDAVTDLLSSETAGVCAEVLDFWLNECSLDMAPTAAEVAHWQQVLAQRGGRFVRLAETCRQWLAENGAVGE